MKDVLFSPLVLGDLTLKNRIIMAPMTRSRAQQTTDMPTPIMQDYYRQRASAGLIISEGIHPCIDGKGYCRTPGLYSQVQAKAWRQITDAVHKKGGLIAAQLMHCGRIGHASNKADGAQNVAPSAIKPEVKLYTEQGMQALTMPKALTLEEIKQTIDAYRQSAQFAKAAGFDAVELHCTSGYLPAQFMATGSNHRVDTYGGSVANRIRFVIEVVRALVGVLGAGRVGVRICPGNPFNDLHDKDPMQTHQALLKEVNAMGIAYVHVIRSPNKKLDAFALVKQHFNGAIITNDSYNGEMARHDIQRGVACAVSFGRDFIASPDLPARIQEGAALGELVMEHLYTPGVKGYSDYPDRFGKIG